MTTDERELLYNITSYLDILEDIKDAREKLEEMTPKITAGYGTDGIGGQGFGGSKVETLAMRRMSLERFIDDKITVIRDIRKAMSRSELTDREKDVIDSLIKKDKLSCYARRKNIYISNVYKIRDSAIRKMIKYLKEHET